MDSTGITQLLQQDSNLLVFVSVLLQPLGLPVPSVPTMVMAASQSTGLSALSTMLLAAVLASLIAAWIWYAAGRRFGYRVLAVLCKMSINPSSCGNQTEARFERLAAMQHIDMDAFTQVLADLRPPHIIDLRTHSLASETGFIPNAHLTEYSALDQSLVGVDKDYPIVTICACPQDAGVVQAAQNLQRLGYRNAFPLRGGFDAWKAAQAV